MYFIYIHIKQKLPLILWFSNSGVHQITWRAAPGTDCCPSPGVSDSVGWGWGLDTCISNAFPGAAAGLISLSLVAWQAATCTKLPCSKAHVPF